MTRFVLKAITAAIAVIAAFSAADAAAQTKYSAEVRRTSFGIPHIKANDFGSIGYGVGYAFAQDNFCMIADEFVTVRGERSRYFGPTATTSYLINNLNSDIFYAYFNGDAAPLTAGLNSMRPEAQAAWRGWVAGYNRYLRDTGAANLPGGCANAPWVRAIDEVDMMRLVRRTVLYASSGNFTNEITNTPPPPRSGHAEKAWDGILDPEFLRDWKARWETLGSNAVGIGADATDNGRGILLGNPHFPWLGNFRLYQFHITVPNQVDVMGAALSGVPFPLIGFNKDVAWSHTVTKVNHFNFYKLVLDPTNPLKYMFDGQSRDLTAKAVTVQVKQADGSLAPVTRTIYSSHLGPMISIPQAGIVWSAANAYVIKDANLDNWRLGDQWFDLNRATNTLDIESALDRNLGVPWVTTTAADKDGNAFFGDISTAPNVDRFQQSVCTPDITAAVLFANLGFAILDGSKSSCDWVADSASPQPGLLPGKRMPRLHRRDFVQNSNDNYWLTNPAVNPYSFYVPAVVGIVPQQQGLRTRLGVAQALARLSGTDGLAGNKFTLQNLQQITLSNRSLAADLFLPDMLTLCNTAAAVSVKPLCDVLAAWDRKFELTSRGAHLFKEFFLVAQGISNVYAVPFDYLNPLTTPSGLAITNPTVATALVGALAGAGTKITNAGLAVDAPLGTVQFAIQVAQPGARIIPVHGGDGSPLGIYNAIYSQLVPGLGYVVNFGTSYIQTVQFTDTGVNAQAFLTYSQSTNPASSNFSDQTARFSAKQWITLPFTESAITGDPAYRTSTISE
jgi:acyl-homoserine-lactone acylase